MQVENCVIIHLLSVRKMAREKKKNTVYIALIYN